MCNIQTRIRSTLDVCAILWTVNLNNKYISKAHVVKMEAVALNLTESSILFFFLINEDNLVSSGVAPKVTAISPTLHITLASRHTLRVFNIIPIHSSHYKHMMAFGEVVIKCTFQP